MRVLLVGAGYIGTAHLDAYRAIENVCVAGLIEANEKTGREVAQRYDIAWYPTLETALVETAADVLDVCVPTFLHERFVIAGAEAGLHVLCEKPAALSSESYLRMMRAAEARGVKLMTAQVVRWSPPYREIGRMLADAELGTPHLLTLRRLAQHPPWSTWHRDPKKSGGGLFDLGAHDVDYLYSLFGMPQSVCAVGWKSRTGCWNHGAASFRWARGVSAHYEFSMEMTGDFPFTAEARVTGDDGTAEFVFRSGVNIKDGSQTQTLTKYPAGGDTRRMPIGDDHAMEEEIRSFLTAVEQDIPVPLPPEETLSVLRMLEGVRQALETGTVVSF